MVSELRLSGPMEPPALERVLRLLYLYIHGCGGYVYCFMPLDALRLCPATRP
jgi:hypothetical protein